LRFRRVKGQCDLYYDKRTKTFYLIVVVDAAEQSQYDHVEVLGVDMGIENIATDSDNQIFESSKVEQIRKRYARLRSRLQHVGTKSAKRKLRKLTGKERRFKKDVNHVISKNIAEKAKGTTRGIGLEDLKNIHSRVTVKIRHSQRDRHHRWSFDELRKCIEYKAKVLGVPIFVVDPKNTSRQCPNPECQCIDKRNRKTRDLFQCLQCRFTAMANYVAAINIRLKAKIMAATVNQPIVGETLISTYKPPVKIGGS